MKFGKRLEAQAHPEWVEKYLGYKILKKELKRAIPKGDEEGLRSKMTYWTGSSWYSLLHIELEKVNRFFREEETNVCIMFQRLNNLRDGDLRESSQEFFDFLHLLQLLRYFVVLNYIAVYKIVKKRNKILRATSLPIDYLSILFEQPFYTSTKLSKITVRTEILAMRIHPEKEVQKEDYSCPICLSLLCDPVVLSCTHRFCWSCLSRSSERMQSCPVCRKNQQLDPNNFRIDWILKEFLEGKFPESQQRDQIVSQSQQRDSLHKELESRASLLPETNHSNLCESPETKPRKCNYNILRILGSGEFGQVFLSTNKKGEFFALKRLSKDHRSFSPKTVAREITAGEMLQHDNIIRFQERFETATAVYLVLEFFEGKNLHSILSARNFKPIPERSTNKMFRQIVSAVSFCHQQKICHRDIKLENLMLGPNRQVKLLDFGLCDIQPESGLSRYPVGSKRFVAPEVPSGLPYSGFAADIWSVGVVLFTLLHGYFPYTTTQFYCFSAGQPWTVSISSKVSDSCRDLLTRMLVVDPSQRLTISQVEDHPWLAIFLSCNATNL